MAVENKKKSVGIRTRVADWWDNGKEVIARNAPQIIAMAISGAVMGHMINRIDQNWRHAIKSYQNGLSDGAMMAKEILKS